MRRGETGLVLSRAILIVRGSSLANDLRCSDVATGNRWEAMKRILEPYQTTNTVQFYSWKSRDHGGKGAVFATRESEE